MNDQGFTTSFSVAQTPEEVFNAINNVRGWWSGEIDGDTGKLGAEFTCRYKDFHRTKQKITALSDTTTSDGGMPHVDSNSRQSRL